MAFQAEQLEECQACGIEKPPHDFPREGVRCHRCTCARVHLPLSNFRRIGAGRIAEAIRISIDAFARLRDDARDD